MKLLTGIKDLINMGVSFDKKEDGTYDLAKRVATPSIGYCIIRIERGKVSRKL